MENVLGATFHLLELPFVKLTDILFNLGSSKTVKIIEMVENINKILRNNFKIDYPIEINRQLSEKASNTYSVSTIRFQKAGLFLNNSDIEILLLLNYFQVKKIKY